MSVGSHIANEISAMIFRIGLIDLILAIRLITNKNIKNAKPISERPIFVYLCIKVSLVAKYKDIHFQLKKAP
jgi:hypothetical protein